MIQEHKKQVALQTWRKILKTDETDYLAGAEDHSILIQKIVNRLRKLGYNIDDRDLLQYQKREQQTKFLITSLVLLNAAKEARFLIPIQTEGNHIPLFAFPDLLLYCNIGYHLSKEQPFYSIEKSCYERNEDIVAHYLSEIRKVKPHGPYCLIGFCRWGEIALKMAQELVAQGEEVPLLVLIEYYSPKAELSTASIKYIRQKIKVLSAGLRSQSSYRHKGKLLKAEFSKSLRVMSNKFVTANVNKGANYSGKVLLIRATDVEGVKDDPYMGWSQNFTGPVESYKVKGDHLDIMLEPSASKIAGILNTVLEGVNRQPAYHFAFNPREFAEGNLRTTA